MNFNDNLAVDPVTLMQGAPSASMNFVTHYDGTEYVVAAAGTGDLTVNFDGNCYVDIRAEDEGKGTVAITVHREALPELIAALVQGMAAAEGVAGARRYRNFTERNDED